MDVVVEQNRLYFTREKLTSAKKLCFELHEPAAAAAGNFYVYEYMAAEKQGAGKKKDEYGERVFHGLEIRTL